MYIVVCYALASTYAATILYYVCSYLKECVEHGNGHWLSGREKLLSYHRKQPNRLHQCFLLPGNMQREKYH